MPEAPENKKHGKEPIGHPSWASRCRSWWRRWQNHWQWLVGCLYDWWHPQSDHRGQGYGHGGAPKPSRPSLVPFSVVVETCSPWPGLSSSLRHVFELVVSATGSTWRGLLWIRWRVTQPSRAGMASFPPLGQKFGAWPGLSSDLCQVFELVVSTIETKRGGILWVWR